MEFKDLKFDSQGLIPAVIQEAGTGQVLMVAYMNQESLQKTLETGTTWFYSRSRQELWNKGATSGHTQYVQSIDTDCDSDALLVKVIQEGDACHTGAHSCFFQPIQAPKESPQPTIGEVLPKLEAVIRARQANPVEGSYTNYLLREGVDKILKKVGEEATEVVIASKNPNPEELIYEASDLLYHLAVLLVHKGLSYEDLALQLTQRFK